MNRLIIFDFFGVISSEVSPKWFARHVSNDEARILKDKYIAPADKGEYSMRDAIDMIASDFGYDPLDIIKEWKSYAILNTKLLEVIKLLRRNNKIALLSNAASGVFEMLFDNFDFNFYFDKYFLSCDYKMVKPNLKFYDLCVKSFGINFDEIYFFDDNLTNVECLKNTNIKGIRFSGNDEIIPMLEKFI